MKARFTLPVLADIENIIDYLAERSPSAADRVAKRLSQIVELICAGPEIAG